MVNTGNKCHLSVSAADKSRLSKADTGLKLITLFKKRSGSRISQTMRRKLNARSHVRTLSSVLSKRKTPEFLAKNINNSIEGRSVRRKLSKEVSDSDNEKPLSVILQGIKSSSLSYKVYEKNTDEQVKAVQIKRRRKRRKRRRNAELDEPSRLQRRTRYLLIKIKLEQNLIDAYSGEGWKGQSREKIKPEKELQRAKKQIVKCKIGIRDAIHQLESLSSDACIEDSVIGPDGTVSHEHIFCAKCKLREAYPDNDIILCDGTCNCAFHQKCLEPPLSTENIPPEDQGWYCKFCECKMEILEVVNAHLGTQFSPNSNWQDVFKEEAVTPDCKNQLNPEEEWPSDESDDDDYDPERNENNFSFSRTNTEEEMSGYASSSSWTSEKEATLHSGRLGNDGISNGKFYSDKCRSGDDDKVNFLSSFNNLDSDDTTDHITDYRRQRRDVDYKKLYDEMFGKDVVEHEHVSDDEDWGPSRRKRRGNEPDAAGTLVNLHGNGDGCTNVIPLEDKKKKKKTLVSDGKRTIFRIPPHAVEKLRRVFAENELPPRTVRLNLSKQLGIAFEKVNKWFKNSRYAALKIRKAEGTERPERTKIDNESSGEIGNIHSTNPVVSEVKSYLRPLITGVPLSKNLRKKRRKKPKSINMLASKKKQHKKAAGAVPNNINKVSTWSSKAVGMKKQRSNLQKEKKRANTKTEIRTFTDVEHQLYLREMERLFRLQDKLENMKKTILGLHSDSIEPRPPERPLVIYVPVAELRERV